MSGEDYGHYVTWSDFKEFRNELLAAVSKDRSELLAAVNRISEQVNQRSRFNWSAASVFLGMAGMAAALVVFAIQGESKIRQETFRSQDQLLEVREQLWSTQMQVINERVDGLKRAKQLHVERLDALIAMNRKEIESVMGSRFDSRDGDRMENRLNDLSSRVGAWDPVRVRPAD